MLQDKDRISKNIYCQDDWRLAGARRRGIWDNAKALLEAGPDKIVDDIKASELRGRGCAGFPTGMKWSFMPKQSDKIVLDVGRSRGALESIDAAPEDVSAMKEMLGDVLKGIDQMSELVVHMRDFTRLDRARVSEFDVNEGLRSVVYLAKSVIPTGIEVVEAYGPVRQIVCTPSQLNQIFLNLIINASQAIEGEGRITVATREEGQFVRIDVADTGTGIPLEIHERIFEPYFTTKPEGVGTGLGLNIARDIARAHGGDIAVDSRPGHGATFTVLLPIGAGGDMRAAA